MKLSELKKEIVSPYPDKSKKKSNPKQFDGVESNKPFTKTRKKTTKK